MPEQRPVNQGIQRLARELGLPLVVTNDAHYLRKEDAEMQDVLLCIQTGKTVDDTNRMKFQTRGVLPQERRRDDRRCSPAAQEALENTVRIAERCNVEFDLPRISSALLPGAGGVHGNEEYFRELCAEGFAERYP